MPSRALTTGVEQVGEVVPQGDRFVVRHQAPHDVSTIGDRGDTIRGGILLRQVTRLPCRIARSPPILVRRPWRDAASVFDLPKEEQAAFWVLVAHVNRRRDPPDRRRAASDPRPRPLRGATRVPL